MNKFRKILLKEYTKKLFSSLLEVSIADDQGNIIISKDLKVRHKDSGLEYTVDDVISDKGKIQVVLRDPEEPRVEPAEEEQIIADNLFSRNEEFSEEYVEEPEEDIIYFVDKDEFEKDYEIE